MKLSETYRPSHPEMIRLKNQMETIQSRLNLELSQFSAGIRNEYEASVRKETLLRSSFEQGKVKATEMQQKSIQYNILKREADTNKDLYKSLLQRVKEVGVSASLQASNIQIVDRAEIPKGPYQPDKRRNLYLAAVIGLFLGVGLAFFLEYLDSTIKSPDRGRGPDPSAFLRTGPGNLLRPKVLPGGSDLSGRAHRLLPSQINSFRGLS